MGRSSNIVNPRCPFCPVGLASIGPPPPPFLALYKTNVPDENTVSWLTAAPRIPANKLRHGADKVKASQCTILYHIASTTAECVNT